MQGYIEAMRTLIHMTLLIVIVGVLPLSTLLHSPQPHSPTAPQLQEAPPVNPDNTPSEDPVPGPVWAAGPALPGLWPPIAEPPQTPTLSFRHPGHPSRIDRPPTA